MAWMVYDYPEPPAVSINEHWQRSHRDEDDDDYDDDDEQGVTHGDD